MVLKMNPSVGVVIPCFNQREYLDDALDSISSQTRCPNTVIVVDDGSSLPISIDRTDLPIKLIRQENCGLSRARNRGFEEIDTTFVVPLDADDELDSRFIERMVDYAVRTSAHIVYCDIETFGDESRVYRHPEYALA